MNIIDHLSVGVPEIDSARQFYDPVMSALGCQCLAANEAFAAYGADTVQFLLMLPADGNSASAGNGCHIAFAASSKEAVDSFHQVAMANNGICNGAPGDRPEYPKPGVYTGFIIDPYGNKLEAIFNGFSA